MVAFAFALVGLSFLASMVAWFRAERLSERLRVNLYEAETVSAYEAWESSDLARVDELLARQMPGPGQKDLRGFEWYYLANLHKGYDAHPLRFRKMITTAAMDKRNGVVFAVLRNEPLLRNDEIVQVDLATNQRKTIHRSSDGPPYQPQCVAVSTDGAMLAVGGQRDAGSVGGPGTIDVRQLNGQLRYAVPSSSLVQSVDFSPDCTRAASLDAAGVVQAWGAATGELQWQRRFMDRAGAATTLEFSPDGRMLAALDTRRRVAFWDASTGTLRKEIDDLDIWPLDLEFSPDGSKIVIVGEYLHILDAPTLQLYPAVYS